MKTYILLNSSTSDQIHLTVAQILDEVNRDRSNQFTPYTLEDLSTEEGIEDALLLTDYQLVGEKLA